MTKDPLRVRHYLHLDEPPRRSALKKSVSNPETVAQWQFLPLIAAKVVTKKVKQTPHGFVTKPKERPICYASHKDAALYAYYAEKLTKQYETLLNARGLNSVVTAFRSADGRCNIHFALEAFQWIDTNRPCVAFAYDISGFFDSLDHQLLRAKWMQVLGVTSLPKDHYAIFRSLTRHTQVERDALYEIFGISRHAPRACGRTRICTPQQFRKIVVAGDLLIHNETSKGIPQGTPISATLSNIYMLDFDEKLNAQVEQWGGFYRRYCDDVLCVIPPKFADEAKAFIESLIADMKLEVQQEKLEVRSFGPCSLAIRPPLQYLGLIYDGVRILLRAGSVARFYSRLRRGVRMADLARKKVARELGVPEGQVPIKRGRLNRSYLYSGHKNFVSYAYRASRVTQSDAIRGQVARRQAAIDRAIKKKE
ncbi:antiviral reverse transcriptase Drt2 [Dyella psychrodurans]|uniref:Reverse transcriptase domain-containing protein n=1 Tax=Dyella psychrodurans TaxID=1927960 RepID=A0A370XBX7_9GAMM|nr:antiviral reverse transcriptase Drt2 [Dyella psychrodurans]RDS85705.1 hypothetical protein DWU99_00010 [Dyella psychrodurans]